MNDCFGENIGWGSESADEESGVLGGLRLR
jgi:hypothetical protein